MILFLKEIFEKVQVQQGKGTEPWVSFTRLCFLFELWTEMLEKVRSENRGKTKLQ